jgi:hypothetical protein
VLAFAPPLAWGSWFFLRTLGFSAALRRHPVSFLLKSCYSCAVPSSPASAPPWRFCFLPRRAAARVRSSISLVEARRRALAVLPCFLPQPCSPVFPPAGCAFEPPYRESRGLWSKLFSHGSFPNMLTKCSMKCLRGDKLFLSLSLCCRSFVWSN